LPVEVALTERTREFARLTRRASMLTKEPNA
jgi:hypothetical protein